MDNMFSNQICLHDFKHVQCTLDFIMIVHISEKVYPQMLWCMSGTMQNKQKTLLYSFWKLCAWVYIYMCAWIWGKKEKKNIMHY